MDIEAIVTKYAPFWDTGPERKRIRAALTELAAGYEQRIRELETERVPEAMVAALVDWVRAAPHGDNCFLHNDGGEFDNCFCGKDSLLAAFDDAAPLPKKEGE